MLVPFTIDPDIFSNDYSQDELYRHIKLIELWERYGCLVLAGPSEAESRLALALRKAPDPIRKRWQSALKRLRQNCCVRDFDPQSNDVCSEWLEALADRVQIVSLEATRALCWGLPEDQYSYVGEQAAEICRFGYESESIGFKSAYTLAQTPIEKGTTWGKVWSERIEPFALESKNITVVDRYALKSLVEHRGSGVSGLERLILQLSCLKKGKPRNLTLMTGVPKEWKHEDLKESIQRVRDCQTDLQGKTLREVRIHVCDDQTFGHLSHYRYIRFDDHHLLQLDTGLEPLAGEMVKRICSTYLQPWQHDVCKPYRVAEKALKATKGSDEWISF